MQIVVASYESGAFAAKADGIWVNDSGIRPSESDAISG